MPLLHCLRHGETDANRAGRWQGHDDQPLNDRGRRQADAVGRALATAGLDVVVSSDLARAVDTARPVAAAAGLEARTDPGLREVHVGSWQGLTAAEAAARSPEGAARHAEGGTGWTDGETYEALQERVVAATRGILGGLAPGARVLLVTHGGAIRALAAHALGLSARQARQRLGAVDNATLTTLHVRRDGRWRLLRYGAPAVAAGVGHDDVQ